MLSHKSEHCFIVMRIKATQGGVSGGNRKDMATLTQCKTHVLYTISSDISGIFHGVTVSL